MYANFNLTKKAGVLVLTCDRVDFRSRKIIRDNYMMEHYINTRRSIIQEDKTILNG